MPGLLDWNAPLSEQPESVRRGVDSAIRSIAANMGFDDIGEPIKWAEKNLDNSTGEGLYRAFSVRQPSTEAASKALNEAGIPGIRFFDGSSRAKGEGTRNIVVFNPDDITQVKRDGELVYDTGKRTK